MAVFNKTSQAFLESYENIYPDARTGAERICEIVKEIAQSTGALVHVIGARAKTPESVRGKLRRKNYIDPAREMMDLIGVRVITYYRDDVDPVVSRLQEQLEINAQESVDKRGLLGLQKFGYRSVHLIARLKSSQIASESYKILHDHWFEIQVRSILEHAWAEIEHEIVYKSGIDYPEKIVRRFASLAGTLELLDNEFEALRHQKSDLIDQYRHRYCQSHDVRKAFDVARLLGFLEAVRPTGVSWRQAAQEGKPFMPGLDSSCVEALKAVGMSTPGSLKKVLSSRRFRYAVSTFAASQGIAPENVSHLAVVVLALIVKDINVVKRYFSEILYDNSIKEIVQRRSPG